MKSTFEHGKGLHATGYILYKYDHKQQRNEQIQRHIDTASRLPVHNTKQNQYFDTVVVYAV